MLQLWSQNIRNVQTIEASCLDRQTELCYGLCLGFQLLNQLLEPPDPLSQMLVLYLFNFFSQDN